MPWNSMSPKIHRLCLLLLVLCGCTPGNGRRGSTGDDDDDSAVDDDDTADDDDTTGDDDDDSTPAGNLVVDVSFPLLEVAAAEQLVFPTYIAHLMGQEVSLPMTFADLAGGGSTTEVNEPLATDFACVALTNESSAAVEALVQVDLVGYASSVQNLVQVGPGEGVEVCLSPVPTLNALQSLQAGITSQASVVVTSGGELVANVSEPVQVTTANDVYWAFPSGEMAWAAVATLVRPNANSVQDVLDDVVGYSIFGTIGTGGYRQGLGTMMPLTITSVAAGDTSLVGTDLGLFAGIVLQPGEQVYVEATELNGTAALDLGLIEAADIADAQAGLTVGYEWYEPYLDAPVNTTYSSTGTAALNPYGLVSHNWDPNGAYSVAVQRSMTAFDNGLDYLSMVYDAMRAEGINYINVPGTFFESAQNVLLPDEMLNNGGGNCIDGTILFASLLELIGVDPVLIFMPQHAMVGMWIDANHSYILPLETTLVGGSATAVEAITAGESLLGQQPWLTIVDVAEARDAGLLPMP